MSVLGSRPASFAKLPDHSEQNVDIFVALHTVMNRYDHTLLPFDATSRHPASGMDGNHATAHLLRSRRKFA